MSAAQMRLPAFHLSARALPAQPVTLRRAVGSFTKQKLAATFSIIKSRETSGVERTTVAKSPDVKTSLPPKAVLILKEPLEVLASPASSEIS